MAVNEVTGFIEINSSNGERTQSPIEINSSNGERIQSPIFNLLHFQSPGFNLLINVYLDHCYCKELIPCYA